MRAEDITQLLKDFRSGHSEAGELLLPRIYDQLHEIAHRELIRRRPGDTINTTALVNEAYIRLAGPGPTSWNDRAHFFAVASKAMRRILIDHARKRKTAKHGGGYHRIPLDEQRVSPTEQARELLDLDEALERLAALNPRLSQVVECRFFGGLTVPETAAALGCSARTVDRDWQKARAWLYRELRQ